MLRQGCHCAYLLTAMHAVLASTWSCNRLVISFENLDPVGSSRQIHSPANRCRTGLPAYLARRAGTATLCRSQLCPPRQELWIWRQNFSDFSYVVGSKTFCSIRIQLHPDLFELLRSCWIKNFLDFSDPARSRPCKTTQIQIRNKLFRINTACNPRALREMNKVCTVFQLDKKTIPFSHINFLHRSCLRT